MLTSLLLALSCAQNPASFVVETTKETLPAAPLINWTAEGALRMEKESAPLLTVELWQTLRRAEQPIPALPLENFVHLATGECVRARPHGLFLLADETLQFDAEDVRPPGGAALRMPQAAVTLWCRKVPEQIDDPRRFLHELARGKRKRDRLLLVNGDQLEGTLLGIDAKNGCQLVVAGQKTTTPLERVALVAFQTVIQARPKRPNLAAQLVLSGGDRLVLTSAQYERATDNLVGKTLFGQAVSVPLTSLAFARLAREQVVFLSDLTPSRYEATPFLGIAWPWFADEDGRGLPIRVAGDSWDKAIALHAPVEIEYRLDGKFASFQSLVAQEAGQGRSNVRILLDGKVRFEIDDLRHGKAPHEVRLDVRGIQTLTIAVGVGERGDVHGMTLWPAARLLKN